MDTVKKEEQTQTQTQSHTYRSGGNGGGGKDIYIRNDTSSENEWKKGEEKLPQFRMGVCFK